MAVPQLIKTSIKDETFAGVTYHIDGELVPVLQIEVDRVKVYFEHHILLWKDTSVEVVLKPLKGGFKRLIAGMDIFMTETKGVGRIAFSRDGAGQVLPIHLNAGQSLDVREHQFLAATDNVEFTFQRVKGAMNMLLGGSGIFIDTFSCPRGEGLLWLHGYGNVFEMNLEPGEQVDFEPGAWIYKDATVKMETTMPSLSTGFFASASIILNRFTGPGRLGLQSMYLMLPKSDS